MTTKAKKNSFHKAFSARLDDELLNVSVCVDFGKLQYRVFNGYVQAPAELAETFSYIAHENFVPVHQSHHLVEDIKDQLAYLMTSKRLSFRREGTLTVDFFPSLRKLRMEMTVRSAEGVEEKTTSERGVSSIKREVFGTILDEREGDDEFITVVGFTRSQIVEMVSEIKGMNRELLLEHRDIAKEMNIHVNTAKTLCIAGVSRSKIRALRVVELHKLMKKKMQEQSMTAA